MVMNLSILALITVLLLLVVASSTSSSNTDELKTKYHLSFLLGIYYLLIGSEFTDLWSIS